jgi:hypothetical protein
MPDSVPTSPRSTTRRALLGGLSERPPSSLNP